MKEVAVIIGGNREPFEGILGGKQQAATVHTPGGGLTVVQSGKSQLDSQKWIKH